MVNWKMVILGFILSLILPSIFNGLGINSASILGLIVAGFVVGYAVKEGAFGGLWNATVAGALGGIISALLIFFGMTMVAGLPGFFVGGLVGSVMVLYYLVANVVIMGVFGAIGGAISS